MAKLFRITWAPAVLAVASCAHGVSTGNLFLTGGGSGDDGGLTSSSPSQSGGPSLDIPEAGEPGGPGDGAAELAGPGSVGLCVTTRTCERPHCDQLQEGGQHEYIEQHPDDGSQIPYKDVATARSAFGGTPSTSDGPCIVEPPDGALFPNNWVRARIRVKTADATPRVYQIRVHADRQNNDLVVYTRSKTWEIPKDVWTSLATSTWGEPITVTVSSVPVNGGGAPVSSQVTFTIAPALADGSIIYWAAVGKQAGQAWLESFSVGDENVAVALTVPQAAPPLGQWALAKHENGALQTTDPMTLDKTLGLNLPSGSPGCVGCHVAVPDGLEGIGSNSLTFVEDWPWDGVAEMVDPGDTGKLPPWLTPGGAEALSMPWLGMMTFSPYVWRDPSSATGGDAGIAGDGGPTGLGQHIMVVAMQNMSLWGMNNLPEGGIGPAPFPPWGFQGGNEWDQSPASQLGWINLSSPAPSIFTTGAVQGNGDSMSLAMAANYGTSWGILQRTGDPRGAASPAWSHLDGQTIVYASTDASRSGREGPGPSKLQVNGYPIQGVADLYSVPYNGGAGGVATPIPGASDPDWNEYYPSLSPDDKLIGFNRVPVADDMYYQAHSEVYVIPAAGGQPLRLKANDPPACMHVQSPGITNSWLKWAPEYPNCDGAQYYWLVFSSAREQMPFGAQSGESNATSQLYLTALVTSGESGILSFPGVFIWNQHTAAAGDAPGIAPFVSWPQSNHTPQWEGIHLPPPPPPPTPPQAPPAAE